VTSERCDFVIGVDFGGTKIALATADLDGRVLEQGRLRTEADRGAPQALRRTLARARALMARTAARCGGRCLGAGSVSPGIAREDRVDLVPTLPGWAQ